MTVPNAHFETADSWDAASERLSFRPRIPSRTLRLEALRIFVRDHKLRELPVTERTLEAHYPSFVFTQSQPGAREARRQTVDVSYGREAREASVRGCEARIYAPGPEPAPGDIDPRSPAVVVWHDDGTIFLLASDTLDSDVLVEIAMGI